MRIAVTREVSGALERCELSHQTRVSIDVSLAREQHRRYQETLASLGCRIVSLPELPEQADSVFVEDTAVVLPEVAVITRPGAESRRAETESMAAVLAKHRRLAWIEASGTLDGGDVLCLGERIYVGLSGRSNRAGIEQLAKLLHPFGYRVEGVTLTGCLHLKTAVTQVAEKMLLINPRFVDKACFPSMAFIEVDPAEPPAGNAVLIGGALVYPVSFPRTRARLERAGLQVHTVDMSETEKAEGGVTCCSLVFEAPG